MPRTQKLATLRTSSRPQQLQSSFLAPVAGLKGLCASFAREWGRALALGAWAVARGGAGRGGAGVRCSVPRRAGPPCLHWVAADHVPAYLPARAFTRLLQSWCLARRSG